MVDTRLQPRPAWQRVLLLILAGAVGVWALALLVAAEWMGGIILGLVSGGIAMMAYSRRGLCPRCGKALTFNPGEQIALCVNCNDYRRRDGESIAEVGRDYVDLLHVFTAYVPNGTKPNDVRWPAVCCVCGAPPTRLQEVRWEKEGWKMQALRVLEHRYDLPVGDAPGVFPLAGVPHCSEHENGVTIYNPNAIGNRDFNVRFRSYAYWQDFKAANWL